MAKKAPLANKSSRRMIFNLEVVIAILFGALVLITIAMFTLYQEREALNDELYQSQQLYTEQNQQIQDLHMKLELKK